MPDRFELLSHRQPVSARLVARRELLLFARRLAVLGVVLLGIIVAGTLAFVLVEGTSVGYGLVWTLDTVSTLGSIVDPQDTGGHLIKVGLIVLGVGTLFYGVVTATEFFVAGHVTGLLDERRTQKMIDALSDHYIICGFGRVGRQVARDLHAAGARYVVIDHDPENRELAQSVGVRFIEGSTSDDDVLRQAGIERARGIIACVDSDAENIFTTLTARELRADISIVARASVEDSEKKLLRAGADRVISPYKASGTEMARLALHPQIAGVVEVAPEYRLEEIVVTDGASCAGRTIGDVRGGAIMVAVRHASGELHPQPSADVRLEVGDVVIALGTPRTLDRLEELFQPARAAAT